MQASKLAEPAIVAHHLPCCAAATPLFLYTPKNTGSHVLQFVFNQTQYVISPFLAPGQTTLQIDASDATNPLITFDATQSPQGQSGAVTVCKSFLLIWEIDLGAILLSKLVARRLQISNSIYLGLKLMSALLPSVTQPILQASDLPPFACRSERQI